MEGERKSVREASREGLRTAAGRASCGGSAATTATPGAGGNHIGGGHFGGGGHVRFGGRGHGFGIMHFGGGSHGNRNSPPHIRSQEEAFAAAAPLPVTAVFYPRSEMPRYGPEASAVRGTRWRTPADSAAGACSAILPREDRSPRPPHWRLARRPRRERMVAAQRRRIWVGRAALLAIRLPTTSMTIPSGTIFRLLGLRVPGYLCRDLCALRL